jgi:Flp pilus assembly protein TadG
LTTEYDGKAVIENEKNVALYLENIMQNHGGYAMRAFERKAISYKTQKTGTTTHSFYVLYTDDSDYHTLSFSATGKWATSQGAWAVDTETDIESYAEYLNGTNVWEVSEIATTNGINTLLTIENVLAKIRSNTTYYYRASIDKNDKHDNCNSALLETLVENQPTPSQAAGFFIY